MFGYLILFLILSFFPFFHVCCICINILTCLELYLCLDILSFVFYQPFRHMIILTSYIYSTLKVKEIPVVYIYKMKMLLQVLNDCPLCFIRKSSNGMVTAHQHGLRSQNYAVHFHGSFIFIFIFSKLVFYL